MSCSRLLGIGRRLRFEEALHALRDVLRFDQANLTALISQRELYIRLEQWSGGVGDPASDDESQPAGNRSANGSEHACGMTYEVGRQLLSATSGESASLFPARSSATSTFLPAYIGLGEILVREGKTKNAGEILQKVYAKTGNIIILHRLEELYLEMGEPSEIIRIYQEACQRHPHNSALKFYLGKLYYRLEMVDEVL